MAEFCRDDTITSCALRSACFSRKHLAVVQPGCPISRRFCEKWEIGRSPPTCDELREAFSHPARFALKGHGFSRAAKAPLVYSANERPLARNLHPQTDVDTRNNGCGRFVSGHGFSHAAKVLFVYSPSNRRSRGSYPQTDADRRNNSQHSMPLGNGRPRPRSGPCGDGPLIVVWGRVSDPSRPSKARQLLLTHDRSRKVKRNSIPFVSDNSTAPGPAGTTQSRLALRSACFSPKTSSRGATGAPHFSALLREMGDRPLASDLRRAS